MAGRVDLHVHSTASDGSEAPAHVVRRARDAGLAAIALTDHDTLAGLAEARAAGAALGVEVVAGVELSIDVRGRDAHLLGLLVDPDEPALARVLAFGRASRDDRNPRIVERLRALGLPITMEEVVAFATKGDVPVGSIGRPHIAGVLVEKRLVGSVKEAFDLYLADDRPAFVPRARLSAAEAIAAIHAAGGIASLAHLVTLPEADREPAVAELAALGLDALEVVHSKYEPADRARFAALAARHGLLPTGGSDYHGAPKPDVAIGSGKDGNVEVPSAWLDALRPRARQR